MNRHFSVLTVVLAVAAYGERIAGAAVIPIDALDAADGLGSWQFSNGAEFEGASGELLLAERDGNGHLVLRYDFNDGGVYVAATRVLDTPAEFRFLRVRVVLPGPATLVVRVRDATGQWFQFSVARAIAPIAAGAWQNIVVALRDASSFWDGAEDGILRHPISAVSFVVESEQVGEVWLDDIEGLDQLDYELDPDTLPLAPVPDEGIDLTRGFAIVVHDLSDNASLDAAKAAGFSWARTDLFWQWTETARGEHNFAPFDSFLARLEQRGMGVLFILAYGNELYGGGPPVTDEAQQAFVDFAVAAAERYAARKVVFEVWNEPDTDRFWPPFSDADAFARLVSATARAVRSAVPDTQLITGGLSWFDFEYFRAMLDAGAASQVDGIGIHPYRGTAAPESLSAHVSRAAALIERYGGAPLPLWDTEWGYSATQFGAGDSASARDRQGVLAVRRMLTSRLLGLPLATWYDLKDDGADPSNAEHNFGLLTQSGAEKPAYASLNTLNAALTQRVLEGVVDVAQPLLCGVKLLGENDTVLVLWSTDPQNPVTLRLPQPTDAWDLYGNPLAISSVHTVQESHGPVYLRYAADTHESRADAAVGKGPDASSLDASAWSDGTSVDGGKGPNDSGLRATPSASAEAGCACRVSAERSKGRALVVLLATLLLLFVRRHSGLSHANA